MLRRYQYNISSCALQCLRKYNYLQIPISLKLLTINNIPIVK